MTNRIQRDGKIYVIAEIGINHNGSLETAKQLISAAKGIGCDAVKFQKRTVDAVYTPEELDRPRESVFGSTNGDLKRGLEFGAKEYNEIHDLCQTLGIDWFASPWDERSVDFLWQYHPPFMKVASACVTDKALLRAMIRTGIPLIVSTGMCNMDLIHLVVQFIEDNGGEIACLMHCTSTYPCDLYEVNLQGIVTLQKEFTFPIGYSGHERGVPQTIMAAALGASAIERHLTLDRTMWGSDQAASLEVEGMRRVIRGIRGWEQAKGDGEIVVYDSERPIIDKLRRKDDFNAT